MTEGSGELDGQAPPGTFWDELHTAFAHYQPQNSLSWNFADAVARLQYLWAEEIDQPRSFPAAVANPRDVGLRGRVRQAVGTVKADGESDQRVQDSFIAIHDALAFLNQRVAELERRDARLTAPVAALSRLLDPPELDPYVEQLSQLFASTPVTVGECGAGGFLSQLVNHGVKVRGIEPLADAAAAAAAAGFEVAVGEVPDIMARATPGEIEGLIATGFIERMSVADAVTWCELAASRLESGAPLALVSRQPASVSGWSALAHDLLPGRPFHSETWATLLHAAGFTQVQPIRPDADSLSYALVAERL